MHLDPHDRNVMVEDSKFSGLVDWQVCLHYFWLLFLTNLLRFQALALPAFMAAGYPPYLRYDGMYEDRYAALNQYGNIEFINKDLV